MQVAGHCESVMISTCSTLDHSCTLTVSSAPKSGKQMGNAVVVLFFVLHLASLIYSPSLKWMYFQHFLMDRVAWFIKQRSPRAMVPCHSKIPHLRGMEHRPHHSLVKEVNLRSIEE